MLTLLATFVTLPTSALADISGYVGSLVSDFWLLIALANGLPLGFYVIRKVIALIPKR
jgi:hypothetical protein